MERKRLSFKTILERLKSVGITFVDRKHPDENKDVDFVLYLASRREGMEDVVAELFARGAKVDTARFVYYLKCYYSQIVDASDETDLSLIFDRLCKSDDMYCAKGLLLYGAKLPPWWAPNSLLIPEREYPIETRNRNLLFEYARCIAERVARCRRALVALGVYCRRSEYHALRAWYRELAKQMWRMRGGGERCGPRGKGWSTKTGSK